MRWPTRDGVIPMSLFLLLESAIVNVAAAEQLQAYYAAFLAAAQVHGGKEGQPALRDAVRTLTALAYPGSSDER